MPSLPSRNKTLVIVAKNPGKHILKLIKSDCKIFLQRVKGNAKALPNSVTIPITTKIRKKVVKTITHYISCSQHKTYKTAANCNTAKCILVYTYSSMSCTKLTFFWRISLVNVQTFEANCQFVQIYYINP